MGWVQVYAFCFLENWSKILILSFEFLTLSHTLTLFTLGGGLLLLFSCGYFRKILWHFHAPVNNDALMTSIGTWLGLFWFEEN